MTVDDSVRIHAVHSPGPISPQGMGKRLCPNSILTARIAEPSPLGLPPAINSNVVVCLQRHAGNRATTYLLKDGNNPLQQKHPIKAPHSEGFSTSPTSLP